MAGREEREQERNRIRRTNESLHPDQPDRGDPISRRSEPPPDSPFPAVNFNPDMLGEPEASQGEDPMREGDNVR